MTEPSESLVPGEELLFVPLGGAGEIGMNLSLYGTRGQWVMVDLGITFGDDTTPGIEIIMPDPSFIADQRERLAGLVLTHAHEDHIGAVPYLWPRLRCPIYATPFTAELLGGKFVEAGIEVAITEVPLSGVFDVGPFRVELVTLTHSIPEPNAVILHTPFGPVLHTGDWKFDPDPIVGEVSDEAALHRLGEAGALAMICDSTNVLQPGHSGSEAALRDSLIEVVGRYQGRVAVTSFASNVARIATMAEVARANGRKPVLAGRALWRMVEAARKTGYLDPSLAFLRDEEARTLPRRETLLVCTGSQGEPRAALARIAAGEYPNVRLEQGDTVIFSARLIPGNERAIGRVVNRLVRAGVEVVTEKSAFVHVSGHPARDELVRMYQLVRPRIAVPVHGEARHLTEQAALARSCQVPEAVVPDNGSVVRLAPGPAQIAGRVPSGRLGADGTRLVALEAESLRERRRMSYNGSAVATLAMTADGILVGAPQISVLGLVEEEAQIELKAAVAERIRAALAELPAARRADDEAVRECARHAVRRSVFDALGRRPVTEIHLLRL